MKSTGSSIIQYMSCLHFHTQHHMHTFTLLDYSCTPTVSFVCPLSAYLHCSFSLPHYLTCIQPISSLCGIILCVLCHCCLSIVSICPLFTFRLTLHHMHAVSVSLCWFILCVQCHCHISTVSVRPALTFSNTMPHMHTFTLLVYSCVFTVTFVCSLSACVHCSLSLRHGLTHMLSMTLFCWIILCVLCQCCLSTVSICPLFTFSHTLPHMHADIHFAA